MMLPVTFLIYEVRFSHSVVSDSCDPMDCSPPASSCPWDSPGKNTRVGYLLPIYEVGF